MALRINVKNEDMRNIRITCRQCSQVFVTEVPEPLSETMTLTLCPKCKKAYGILRQGEKWKVKPVGPGEFRGTVAMREDQLDEIRKRWQDDKKEDSKDEPEDTEKPFVN